MHSRQRHGKKRTNTERQRGTQKTGGGKENDERETESLGHNKRSSVWQSEVNEKRQCKVVRGKESGDRRPWK